MRIIKQLALAAAVVLLAACKTPTDVAYFQDLENLKELEMQPYEAIKLKPTDKVFIVVKCKNAEITNMLNLGMTNQIIGTSENASLNQNNGISGYTIDKDGNIDFPLLGKIHIEGLTREGVEKKIKHEIENAELAKDVVVTCDYMNLRYYVLGEVKSPGAKSFARDKLTITEALAQSGDLSLYGIRNKIYVIRQEGNKKVTYQMNMLSAEELLKSPAYYIQQNDVIYVDANNTRKRQSNANGNQFQSASLWMSMASVLTTLAVLIFK